jgi:hypothetical protein
MVTPRPHPTNPKVAKVTLVFQRDTRTFVNTFHVSGALELGAGDLITIANFFKAWYTANYKAQLPAGVGLNQIQVRKLWPPAPLAYDLNVSPPEPGLKGLPMEAANSTLTMSWRTGFAGKAFRGRDYVPALAESEVTQNDTVISSLLVGLASAGGALINAAVLAGFPLGVFHAPLITPKLLDNTITEILTCVLEYIVDSQRRRLPGRGR